ncbi:MAG: hypothetical protein AAFX87_14870 [Bacteroidota bacterium]
MSRINNINLAFACPIKLNDLSQCDGAYHCDQCNHKVIDFTNKSQEELNQAIANSDTRVCGMFKGSQMSREFRKYAAVTLLASSALFGQSCSKELVEPMTEVTDETPIEITEIEIEEEVEETDIIFGYVHETMPSPIGGHEKFYAEISKELRIPSNFNGEGKVYISFFVDTSGNMVDFEVLKTFADWAGEEAVRALKAVNHRFVPGTQRNQPVKVKLIYPVTFNGMTRTEK